MEAQRYPEDYDGIVAGAPAINWTKLHLEQLWGPLVMPRRRIPVPACKFAAATAAAIAACDGIDGVKDGVIEDPQRCTYDPKSLVGTSAGDCGTFTEADARRHPQDLGRAAACGRHVSLVRAAARRRLRRAERHQRHSARAAAESDHAGLVPVLPDAGSAVGLDDADARGVRAVLGSVGGTVQRRASRPTIRTWPRSAIAAARFVMWHGWADQLIYPGGSIDYYTRVQQQMGGAEKTAEFMRLFMAPGVGHCGGGAGPAPTGH